MFREGGKSTALVSGGRRKVHTTFDDGSELVEEYEIKTGELAVRKRRAKSTMGKEGDWEYLYGEAPPKPGSGGLLQESTLNPLFSRKDIRQAFQWRVRNLPYPPDTYSVTIDHNDRKIVVRTSNKKYYKRFNIPELDVLKLPLLEGCLTWSHTNNTLVISYAKPPQVLAVEQAEIEENRKMRSEEDGNVECKQQ